VIKQKDLNFKIKDQYEIRYPDDLQGGNQLALATQIDVDRSYEL
jgi:hypothetical protein